MTNCIAWDDTPDEILDDGASPIVTYSCVMGGYPGTGNIDGDPLFVDPVVSDLHILYTSPCRDAGDDTAIADPEDFEGDPRIALAAADMGADEFHTHLYYTGNATPGGDVEGKLVGLPGTSPTGLIFGSGVLDPPISTKWGPFYMQAPWFLVPVSPPLPPIPPSGVIVLSDTLPVSPAAPYDIPMQALIGLDPDSLTNLCVLEVR
jgi:hypothetical protein